MGSAAGIVPYQAELYRDELAEQRLVDLQRLHPGRLTAAAGCASTAASATTGSSRSTSAAACRPTSLRPDLLPSQCETATDDRSVERQEDPAVRQLVAARLGDLRPVRQRQDAGPRERVVLLRHQDHAGQRARRAVHADRALTWGPNQSSGACSTRQRQLLDRRQRRRPRPGQRADRHAEFASNARFVNGVLHAGRQHRRSEREDRPHARSDRRDAARADLRTWRSAWTSSTASTIAARRPTRSATSRAARTDPLTAIYVPTDLHGPGHRPERAILHVCTAARGRSGVGSITVTNPNYQTYTGVDITATKRFSNRWQMADRVDGPGQPAATSRHRPASYINPTGCEFTDGHQHHLASTCSRRRAATRCRGTSTSSANFNRNQGGTRTLSINGPGDVYGGTTGDHHLQHADRRRRPTRSGSMPTKLLDIGLQKVVKFRGGKNRVKLMLDGFNMFNVNTIQPT